MRSLFHFLVRVAVLALTFRAGTASADGWPEFRAPLGATVEMIAADMLLNGKQCRMVRFQAHASDDEAVAFYRAEFGSQHVENRVKADRVIATRRGDYFVTVQLHMLDSHTVEGTAITTMITGKPETSAVLVDTKKLLPADTHVISTVQTNDAATRSVMIVGVNRNSLQANRNHLVDAMADLGFHVTGQSEPQDSHNARSLALQLASQVEEASVTISDAGPYRSVVINRIREGKR